MDDLVLTMDGKKTAAARQARVRSLIIACATVVGYALAIVVFYALDHYYNVCLSQAYFNLPCVRVTAAGAAGSKTLWLAVLEAAVAALALRFPCRRRWVRRALAYLELAVAAVSHCMYARAVRILLPGYLATICKACIAYLAARDLAGFVGLLRGGE